MFPRKILIILLLGLTLTTALSSKSRSENKLGSQVYFPVILIGELDKNFGHRVSESFGLSRNSIAKSIDDDLPPVSSPKPTTTTEKLPLAQESHVASHAVTKAPGPSYLTDSLYYNGDPTSSPDAASSGDENNHHAIPVSFDYGEESDENPEGEELGMFLQSVSSYEHPSYGNIRFDLLINPAKMHYIPPNSLESFDDDVFEKEKASVAENVTAVLAAEYDPLVTELSIVHEKPTSSKSDGMHPLVTESTLTENHTATPELAYRKPDSTTKTPLMRYKPPTVKPPRISRPKYSSPDHVGSSVEISPVYRPFSVASASSSSFPEALFLKSSDIAHSEASSSFSTSQISSKAFLPIPASNPFTARISKPVVKPVYDSDSKAEILKLPAHRESFPKGVSATTIEVSHLSLPESSEVPSQSTKQRVAVSLSKNRQRVVGNRNPKIIKPVEIYRSESDSHGSGALFGDKEQDHRFDISRPAASAPRRQVRVRPSTVTIKPIQEAPIYRTSTKAYRAPSSLYQIRGPTGKTVTAPSQPDFILTDANIYVPQEYDKDAIPGNAGVDYPIYSSVPETSFACSAQDHPGLYADKEAKCQVFHICQEGGREDSFLCPNGTVFNQQYFVCDWWYNFACDFADRFYSLNAFIYELPETNNNKYYT